MAFHINPTTGDAGRCSAKVKCPFGDLEKDHYGSADAARASFEAKMGSLSVPSSQAGHRRGQWRPSASEIAVVRTMAHDLAMEMNANPDLMPAVFDPDLDGSLDEEDAYILTMETLKRPEVARNQCIAVAETVQDFTKREWGVVEEAAAGPYLNIHAANTYTDEQGHEWVIDYTYSQVDPDADWPHVDALSFWRNNIRQNAGRLPLRTPDEAQ